MGSVKSKHRFLGHTNLLKHKSINGKSLTIPESPKQQALTFILEKAAQNILVTEKRKNKLCEQETQGSLAPKSFMTYTDTVLPSLQ